MSNIVKLSPTLPVSLLALTFAAGCTDPPTERIKTTVQEVRAQNSPDGRTVLSLDVLTTAPNGEGLPCTEGAADVTIEISRNGLDGPWAIVDSGNVQRSCVSAGNGDLALVMDNSGSVAKEIGIMREGAMRVVDRIVGSGGRVSLVRVSTDATVEATLTSDVDALSSAVDDLFITNGWTALWDGVRMGNETLGAAPAVPMSAPNDLRTFCAESRKQGIVVFTDGAENNSAHQRLANDDYPGDGIDTTLGDLLALKVGGTHTPVYAIGLGGNVDEHALSRLAQDSGGRFLTLDSMSRVDEALDTVSDYFGSAERVCAMIPSHLCGSLDVRVTNRWVERGESFEEVSVHHLDLPCDTRARGRVATILLTMNATETTEETMMKLVANTVNWASPVDAPRVLFVLDDFHHGEFDDDTHQIYEKLVQAGYDAEFLEEPDSGVTAAALAGFDVIWFSNPGYPIDDVLSFNALVEYSRSGGGVVFQGDDMSWSWGRNFPTTPLTRLEHVDNGVDDCGVHIDNQQGGRYRVTMNAEPHAIIAGIEGQSFLYGDDIDTATPLTEATEVVAWATVEGKSGCRRKPVVTAFTPPP